MSPTAVVRLTGQRLELIRHPLDGQVVAFASADDAFAFAVSLEVAGAASTATVQAPASELLHMLQPGAKALDLTGQVEEAA